MQAPWRKQDLETFAWACGIHRVFALSGTHTTFEKLSPGSHIPRSDIRRDRVRRELELDPTCGVLCLIAHRDLPWDQKQVEHTLAQIAIRKDADKVAVFVLGNFLPKDLKVPPALCWKRIESESKEMYSKILTLSDLCLFPYQEEVNEQDSLYLACLQHRNIVLKNAFSAGSKILAWMDDPLSVETAKGNSEQYFQSRHSWKALAEDLVAKMGLDIRKSARSDSSSSVPLSV